MKIDDLISESEVQKLDELKAGKYAQVASLLGALAAQHGGKAADAATVGWKQQAPHALATLATYADPKKLGALPATMSADELNKGEDEWKRQRDKIKIGRLIPNLKEGVVSRRGNKLQVGSLELQLYPDHIFYVVGNGKDADLSIYKDGAFKPPRNNEIYLKDATNHGVPQAFINLFAKFFATQDIDVVVNGLEALFKSHVKEGNKENKEKKKQIISPKDRPKMKMNDFNPRTDLKKKVAEEDKRMSRAGKGVMKYGKDGMKALAKAGRDGASEEKLDKIRDKYDKYEESLEEKWSKKYKDSINCSNPKGFSQKAHCAGKKKNEGTEPDHEASMAKGQLYNACKNAMALMKMIQDGENLEGWVAAKITKAADYLDMVHDYMAYEEVSEEKQRLDPKCWTGYRKQGTKMKGGVRVNNCVKVKK